ncbi:cobyric acid synthase [Cytobacillus purgationiresistens]|uniref:Cobyric acid synthase n=1 Tax=Cytobacillus purgationiresistens TaxID=863449 RepID=A0ABU0APL8_9BACI|nr:cobyric acid synthase [Cytobacillus purgationiresistens]MDQ0273237.1 adenosylcobyric acid synthase [Cytobacillus purgationiresistens]
MKGVMVQGTSSDVGKSLIATAICRVLANEGLSVSPFKSQNMSNNSYVTADGKEIGRAQGIQAEAAKTNATVWMNPILLKPRTDASSEVVLFGEATKTLSGRGYRETFYHKGLEAIQTSLAHLGERFEWIVMEGAGSPVEINLKDKELVNMKVAELADIPVILVADIDRGGVFASIIGTLELLSPEERVRVKGLIINKFRGDLSLFDDGLNWLEERCGIPVLGVLPFMDNHMIDGEDSLSIPPSLNRPDKPIQIVVIKPPYISNYTDVEPFYFEEDVSIRWVSRLADIGTPDAVILPGTKSTISDLRFLKQEGFDLWLKEFAARGGYIAGICGGYQMLGEQLLDPFGTDTGNEEAVELGIGLIPAVTTFLPKKTTIRSQGVMHINTRLTFDQPISGYEIHLGETVLDSEVEGERFITLDHGEEEGYFAHEGKIIGTYMHHIFHHDQWRNWWLNRLRKSKGFGQQEVVHISDLKDEKYDELAFHFLNHINWDALKSIMNHGEMDR